MSKEKVEKDVVSRKFLNYAAKSLEKDLNALHWKLESKIKAMGLEGKVDFLIESNDVLKEFSVRWVVDHENVKVVT